MDLSRYENIKLSDDKTYRHWDTVVKEVANFMGESTLIGKWRLRCKGIPHTELSTWMRDAEKAHNPPDWPKQKLFNIQKKKYLSNGNRQIIQSSKNR